MLRKSLMVFVGLMFLLIVTVPSWASLNNYSYVKTVKLILGQKTANINGKSVVMDQSAYIKNSRTMVPFRFLGEALGAVISWDSKTKSVVLKLGSKTVKVITGSKTAYIDGKKTNLDTAAEIKGGRAFIPLRFVGEAFGAVVDYEGQTKTIILSIVNISSWQKFIDSETGELIMIYSADWQFIKTGGVAVIKSPQGSQVWYSTSAEEQADIIANTKAVYLEKGFTLSREKSFITKQEDKLTIYTYTPVNPEGEAEAYSYCVVKEDFGCTVFELNSTLSLIGADLSIFEKMISV
jgi:hypothetical protein